MTCPNNKSCKDYRKDAYCCKSLFHGDWAFCGIFRESEKTFDNSEDDYVPRKKK